MSPYTLMNLRHNFDTPMGEVGLTIRCRFKWAEVPDGTDLTLSRCEVGHPGEQCTVEKGCTSQGTARVVGRWVGRFKDLPARLIALEHSGEDRLYPALLKTMEMAYPGFTDHDHVTGLLYLRTGLESNLENEP